MDDDAKRLEVLKFILKRHAEPTVTSLMKIAYLADLLSLRQKNGVRLTNYNYIRYYYGPFDKTIYHDLEALVKEGLVKPIARWSGRGDGDEYYVFEPSTKLSDSDETSLKAPEIKLLTQLLDDIRGYGAKTLTEAAYKTRPMTKLHATLGGQEHLFQPLDLNA